MGPDLLPPCQPSEQRCQHGLAGGPAGGCGQGTKERATCWRRGEKALAVARQLLAEQEAFADIELFSLRAIASGKRLDIRLDNMTGGLIQQGVQIRREM